VLFRTACLLTCLAALPALFAQDATITGIVTDSASAVVPGVSIKVRNTETNDTRTVVTNHEGNYTVYPLPVGKYELTAEMAGFRTHQQTGIVLEIEQTLRSDIQLVIGNVTESVQVTAQVAVLNTENGAIKGDVIVNQEINDLPLDGRDFTNLAFLVPGVMPNAQGGQGSFASINGARADSTNFYVDGFNNRNARGAAAQVRPNMDAMQEFKMEVSGYSAEMGRMAGGVLNMVMRSGTNQFHGDVFEYVRNDLIDARGFFDPTKNPLHRNQYGAMLSGPIRLPKIYDGHNRTFFMFSWESYKQSVRETSITHVPSLLERQGDFSQSFSLTAKKLTVTDPLNKNTPFPDNLIPLNRFNPVSVNLLKYYPQPNRADLRNNYITAASDPDAWDSFIIKTDHRFNQNNTISYRFQIRFNNTSTPFAGSPLGIFGDRVDDDRSLMGIVFTHLFTPTFLVEYNTGFSRASNHQNGIWGGIDVASQIGLPDSTRDPDLVGFPLFNVTDYASLGGAANEPVEFAVTEIQNSAKFTWVKGKHVMKFGFEYDRTRFNQPFYNNNRGTFNFTGSVSGAPLSDFVLGQLNAATRTVGWNRNYLRAASSGAFFNDDFKIRPNLTLNLGMRYELDNIPYDRYNHLTNFVPEIGKVVLAFNDTSVAPVIAAAGLTDHVTYAEAAGLSTNLVKTDYNNFAPRVGFAWTPFKDRRTVLRGGYGIFYTGILLNPFRNNLQNTFPYAQTETYTHNSTDPSLVTLSNPFPAQLRVGGGTTTSTGIEVNDPTGYLQSWNLTIERDLGSGMSLEIGYAGSKGTKLSRFKDINLPRRSEAAYLAGTAVQQLRPFPYFNGTIMQFQFHSNSIYNAGQISLRRRGRGGTFFRLNYAYSKSIDDASQLNGTSDGGLVVAAQDVNNRRADRSRSDWDRGHVVTASFSWQIPVGRGRRLLTGAHGIQQGALGGWQFSGTTFMATGAPITILTAGTNLNVGDSQKPNRLATGIPASVPGQRRGVDYPWFDPDAFVAVPSCVSTKVGCPVDQYGFKPFVYGNAGRNILDGPGRSYFNLAMMKNFRVQERKNFQLRLESFNAFNHPNFQLPNNQFNASGAGLITAAILDGGAGSARVFQAGLKFEF
jgi:Carboxypeptidase regulatory-like domain/TonB-dependent Receptor Plug Domain